MSTKLKRGQLFPLGRLMITPNAQRVLPPEVTFEALERHALGDWGEASEADKLENELSLREGFRIMSVYRSPLGVRFWVITEADRSSTTVLLPEDY